MGNLLFRRFMMSNTQNNGGNTPGGEEDANAPIILDIQSSVISYDEYTVECEVTITSNNPMPYDGNVTLSVNADDDYNISYDLNSDGVVVEFQKDTILQFSDIVTFDIYNFYEADLSTAFVGVSYFDPFDISIRLIPTYCIAGGDGWMWGDDDSGFIKYIYDSNINHIPVSDDEIGSNSEICPIKRFGPVDNTSGDRFVWYNYDGNILFRDTYNGKIYYISSYGNNFYGWN